MKGSYFFKIVGFFPATFSKINTVRWFFQGYYRDLSNFLLYSMFPEDLLMGVSIFNVSRRPSNGGFYNVF